MKNSKLQTILLAVFGVAILVAVLMFSGVIPTPGGKGGSTGAKGTVVLWGTLDDATMRKLLYDFNEAHQGVVVNYVQKNPDTFNSDLVEAIASGTGPDLIMMPADSIIQNASVIFHIPYTAITQRTFLDTYVDEGKLYLAGDGILGLPISVDPMIMYYNKDMFSAAAIAQPPATWSTLTKDVLLLTKKDSTAITQSAVGLGTYPNVDHAKDIMSMLLLQAGNPIVARVNDIPAPTLIQSTLQSGTSDTETMIDFYTAFADPLKDIYTWNLSNPDTLDSFINGNLAIYFGYASELPGISAKNPNLNFDIASVPQIPNQTSKVTFGRMNAIAIVKNSKNFTSAYIIANMLAGSDFAGKLVTELANTAPIAPARRDLIASAPQAVWGPLVFNSALISEGWLDPGDSISSHIMGSLINDVVQGALSVPEAVSEANTKLSLAFPSPLSSQPKQ